MALYAQITGEKPGSCCSGLKN